MDLHHIKSGKVLPASYTAEIEREKHNKSLVTVRRVHYTAISYIM